MPTPQEIARLLTAALAGDVRVQEPLRAHTTFQIGGNADFFVSPAGPQDVQRTVEIARTYELPWTVLGQGSNVLVRDGGIRGLVLRLGRRLGQMTFQGETVTVQAGAALPRLGREAVRRGLAGLEFTAGVPGTVGGAVRMNAGCCGQSFGEVVQSVTGIDAEGRVCTLTQEDLQFGYRHSVLRERALIVVEAALALTPDGPEAVAARYQEIRIYKRRTQPLGAASAGCVFKNPPGYSAGELIEAVGGKGLRWGGAQVSSQHANFIVNVHQARAADVLRLIELIRERVHQQFGVWLEMEIEVLGEENLF